MTWAGLTNASPEELVHDLGELQAWSRRIMERKPDVVIGDGDGDDYMLRWFVIPRNVFGGVYLHRFLRSDKDVPHDHPWDSTSVLIEGQYDEMMFDRGLSLPYTVRRVAGDINHRKAEECHRVVLTDGPATSLFFFGPRRRQWGFHCPMGWVRWDLFVDARDKGQVGLGCGED